MNSVKIEMKQTCRHVARYVHPLTIAIKLGRVSIAISPAACSQNVKLTLKKLIFIL